MDLLLLFGVIFGSSFAVAVVMMLAPRENDPGLPEVDRKENVAEEKQFPNIVDLCDPLSEIRLLQDEN